MSKDQAVSLRTGEKREGHQNADQPAPDVSVKPNGQHPDYWVLSDDERAKGFVRPYRTAYVHKACGTVTTMSRKIAETYARNPSFYGATFCCACRGHFPVSGFHWDDETQDDVGT